ncbi:DNA methyltransferase [Chloroflexota bacterium]
MMEVTEELQIETSVKHLFQSSSQDAIILDLFSFNANGNNNIVIHKQQLYKILSNLKTTGSFWLIANHIRQNIELIPYGFELAEIISKHGFFLRNIITWFIPNKLNEQQRLTNRYAHIFLFVKDSNAYYFNKDLVREKHIWKEIEWGHRTGRYNPLGKDPSNVWLKTEDDKKGNITKHIPLSFDDVINRIKLIALPPNGEIIIYSDSDTKFSDSITFPTKEIISIASLTNTESKIRNVKKSKAAQNSYRVLHKSSEVMNDLVDGEVDLIVTSPPYWDLKNYNIRTQIGYSESYDTYLSRINRVWQECYRVLNDKGTFWLNINTKVDKKAIRMIQYDFVKQCTDIGFRLWDIVIWHKSVSGPAPANNLTDKFEYVLIFSKKPDFYINKDYEENRCDYKIESLNTMGNVWNINRLWGSIGKGMPHPAMYPDELIERILNFGTVEGDLVLDPFLGSGTTLIVAKKLLRSCIGYEINSDYFAILKKRLYDEKLENLFNINENVFFT